MTLPSTDDQVSLISHIRKSNGTTLIIANAAQYPDMDVLYRAGADYVMMPHLLGGNWIADVLKTKHWTAKTFSDLKSEQKKQEHTLGDAKRFA